jgi:hypothetical protein
VEGERLFAYGGANRMDADTPIRSSSYWEGARDGVDDANLARILEWYQKKLTPLAKNNPELAKALKCVEADKATWFENDSPDGFKVLKKHFLLDRKPPAYRCDYDYFSVIPPSSSAIELMKKRILDDLELLRPYVDEVAGSLFWHDWKLVTNGKVVSRIIVPTTVDGEVEKALSRFSDKCEKLCGEKIPVDKKSSLEKNSKKSTIVIGTSKDPLVASILKARGWSADDKYPGPGNYLIKRSKKDNLLLVVGTDEKGLVLGLKNFSVFLRGEGMWMKKMLILFCKKKKDKKRQKGTKKDKQNQKSKRNIKVEETEKE